MPHFEKMLYDQAQLLSLYLQAYSMTRNVHLAQIAQDVIEYVITNLYSSETRAFFSAEDADSLPDYSQSNKKGMKFSAYFKRAHFVYGNIRSSKNYLTRLTCRFLYIDMEYKKQGTFRLLQILTMS